MSEKVFFPSRYIWNILTLLLQGFKKGELLPCFFHSYHFISSLCLHFYVFPKASKQTKKITCVVITDCG